MLPPLTAKLVVALVLLGAYGLPAMAIGRHVPLATLAVWLAGPLARLFRQTWRGPVREQGWRRHAPHGVRASVCRGPLVPLNCHHENAVH